MDQEQKRLIAMCRAEAHANPKFARVLNAMLIDLAWQQEQIEHNKRKEAANVS